jgi:hypothetical protein
LGDLQRTRLVVLEHAAIHCVLALDYRTEDDDRSAVPRMPGIKNCP